MAKAKNKGLEKKYAELKLRYALENDEVRELFIDWSNKELECNREYQELKFKKEREYLELRFKKEGKPREKGKNLEHESSQVWEKALEAQKTQAALFKKLNELGISYNPANHTDLSDDLEKLFPANEEDSLSAYPLSSVLVKRKERTFDINKSEELQLRKIFKEEGFEKNGEWPNEICDSFEYSEESIRYIDVHQFNSFLKSNSTVNNKGTKKCYSRLIDSIFTEYDFLEDGRYLTLRIDLSNKTKDIERDLQSVISGCKNIIDDFGISKAKNKARRQDIELYERYLTVYHLVQEKGEQKWTEIAKEVFPEDSSPESAYVKTYNAYKEAKRLIAEGLP